MSPLAEGPGRSCPVSHRYGPQALAAPATLKVDSLWVAGGLYGNPFALQALVESYGRERGTKALVFNGDFHWFDADPRDFKLVNDTVLSFDATRGNVETELAEPSNGAGCGCGYPEWVDQGTVERSNRIIDRLRLAAESVPNALPQLASLPMYLLVDVAGVRVAIVHGDAESLAGWRFSQEALATPAGCDVARRDFDLAKVDVFASSHTCLPVLQAFGGRRVLVNNGAAGMPNFKGTTFGLVTRVACSPSNAALHAIPIGDIFVEAIPLHYVAAAWQRHFVAHWPEGSDAYASYYLRIVNGPHYSPDAALRLPTQARDYFTSSSSVS